MRGAGWPLPARLGAVLVGFGFDLEGGVADLVAVAEDDAGLVQDAVRVGFFAGHEVK